MIEWIVKQIENGSLMILMGLLYTIQSIVYIKLKRYDQALIFFAYAVSFIGFIMALKK